MSRGFSAGNGLVEGDSSPSFDEPPRGAEEDGSLKPTQRFSPQARMVMWTLSGLAAVPMHPILDTATHDTLT